MDPRVHILFEFKQGPYGGGNQFLKALRSYLRRTDRYAEDPEEAEIILFNSHNFVYPSVERGLFRTLRDLHSLDRVFLHRIDGPIRNVRGEDSLLDDVIYTANQFLADGTIFQSQWSREENLAAGLSESPFSTTVINAPDPNRFYPSSDPDFGSDNVSLIATSWSANWRKGFDVYQYLDHHLDFDRYSMTFVGNSPIKFENIEHIDPVANEKVGDLLREHDLFVTGSRQDTCSNSLIEALHCGLPVVARRDGGHPEIVGDGGALFDDPEDAVTAIETVTDNYWTYREQIDLPSIEQVGRQYYKFGRRIFEAAETNTYTSKRIGLVDRVCLTAGVHRRVYQWRFKRKARTVLL